MDQTMIDARPRFAGERAALLAVLADLAPDDWGRPTACAGWTVQDVAAHLLGDDLGRLAGGRDGHANPNFWRDPAREPYAALVGAIDRQNAAWVETMRRLSPRLLTELLRWSGDQTAAYFATLDPRALPGGSVDWVSPAPAPVWLDLAREYTERWHHQQHIREAVGRPGLMEREWLHPALATFVLGLPRALAPLARPAGTRGRLVITGAAGGAWEALATPTGWTLAEPALEAPAATVTLDPETAWRRFTNGLTWEAAHARAAIIGDAALAGQMLQTVSILA